MTIIFVLVYIALTRLAMWLFDRTTISWTIRLIIIIAINAGATILMFDYIDNQFEPIRRVFEKYYERYE
ncbi:MAG: hypothetical protein IIB39_06540 [Candidatus Marinimicrobia bacterium]|nr:hypothetical protein [Candidatus Neomarinimicrobiota bacterium]